MTASTPEILKCSLCGKTEPQVEVRKGVFANPPEWCEVTVKKVRIQGFRLCGDCIPELRALFGKGAAK